VRALRGAKAIRPYPQPGNTGRGWLPVGRPDHARGGAIGERIAGRPMQVSVDEPIRFHKGEGGS
jgi:hypothetical protein